MPRLQIFRYPRGGIRVLPLSLPEPFGRNKSGGKAPIVGKLFVVASSDDSCRIRGLMYDGFSALFRRLQYLEEKERGAECSLGTGGRAPVYLCRPLGEDSRRLLGQQLIVPIDTYYHNTSVHGEEEGQFFPFLRILCRPPFFYSYISYRESFHAKFSILIESSLKSPQLRRKISRNPCKKNPSSETRDLLRARFLRPVPRLSTRFPHVQPRPRPPTSPRNAANFRNRHGFDRKWVDRSIVRFPPPSFPLPPSPPPSSRRWCSRV